MIKNRLSKIIYAVVTILFATIFLLYTSANLSLLAQTPKVSSYGVALNYMENTGAAFSIMQDYSFLLVAFSVLAIILLIYYTVKNFDKIPVVMIFWISILISGVSSNLYERTIYGFVKDYFQLTFINFPVFNLADMFITVSAIAIMIILFKKNFLEK